MLNTVLKRLAFGAPAAIVLAQTPETRATDEVPLNSRVAGQQISRTFLMAPDFALYPGIGFPLNTKFVRVTTSSVGNANGLGKFTIDTVYEAELAFVDGLLTFVSDGVSVTTAANGDEFFGAFTLYRVVGQNAFTGNWELTGGTGRFEGVTGAGNTVGVIFPDPSGLDSFYYEDEGWRSSVGSQKRNK